MRSALLTAISLALPVIPTSARCPDDRAVIPLPDQGPDPAPCRCPRCELDALADRERAVLEQSAGELPIPREALTAAHADLIATTDLLLPPSEETKRP